MVGILTGALLLTIGVALGYFLRLRGSDAFRSYLIGIILPIGFLPWSWAIDSVREPLISAISFFMEDPDYRALADWLDMRSYFIIYIPFGWRRPAFFYLLWIGTVLAVSAFFGIVGFPHWGGVARFNPLTAVLFAGWLTWPALPCAGAGAALALLKRRPRASPLGT